MLRFALIVLAALFAVSGTVAAYAGCPAGYAPCGQTNQLCCPG